VVKNYGGVHTFVYDSDALNIAAQKSLVAGVRSGGIFVFVYLLLFIMINVISISLANFEERRAELASLRSVGMSSKQLYKLFAFESFNIMGKSWLLGVVVGHSVGLIVYTIIRYYNRTINFINLRSYSFNLNILVLTLVLVVMVMVIQVLLVISKDNNESIVEGMRKIG
jgi:putative ABC transport system permease protein